MADIIVQGIFVADTAFYADRLPRPGETLIGRDFLLGPGGKGSNQAIAAARAGGDVAFFSKLGRDDFGAMARTLYREAGVDAALLLDDPDHPTGAAFVFVDAASGENAIIVTPGAAGQVTQAEVTANLGPALADAILFVTQLEQPVAIAHAGLAAARAAGVRTILNPAPAAPLPSDMLALADIVTPNETEAAMLTGLPVTDGAQAAAAGRALQAQGAGAVILTLGGEGALLIDGDGRETVIPAVKAGPVVDTTGAGDAFTGALSAALATGADLPEACRFAAAGAGVQVTRRGTARAMPDRANILAALQAG